MPVISVRPHDRVHLRKQIAEFQSLFHMLTTASREARDLANTYTRAAHWLDSQGTEYRDLVDRLKGMAQGATYQAKSLTYFAEQIESNWDLAVSLKELCFKDMSDVTPLEFALPVDFIGAPPSDPAAGSERHD